MTDIITLIISIYIAKKSLFYPFFTISLVFVGDVKGKQTNYINVLICFFSPQISNKSSLRHTMYLQPCNGEQLQRIYDEYHATERSVRSNVFELIRWLEEQPHLPNITDEDFLWHFLIRCGNDVEKTKTQLNLYYTAKYEMPDIFTNRDLSSAYFKKCTDLGMFVPLPKLTPEGHRVGIFRMNPISNKNLPTPLEYVKAVQTMRVISMKMELCNKAIMICDLNNMSAPFITLLSTSMKRMMTLAKTLLPFPYHKIYIINAMPVVVPLIALAKKVLSAEISERIEIWNKKTEDFVEIIPADILPSDYGGKEKPFHKLSEQWWEELRKYNSWLSIEENYVADLSKLHKNSGGIAETRLFEKEVEEAFQCLDFD